ncbi:MAG: hypothetical protein ACM3ZB_07005 [bacterium]
MSGRPIYRSKNGKIITIDFLAVERAIKRGNLSERDWQSLEALFPGLSSRLRPEPQSETQAPGTGGGVDE